MPSTAESDTESDQTQVPSGSVKPNYGVIIGVRRARAMTASLVMAGAFIAMVTRLAGDGVRVGSFFSNDVDATEQKHLLDKYNSISGGLTALISKPLDLLLSVLTPVVFLCIATKFSTHHENRRGYIVMLAIGAVGYLINTSFSALNVQVVPGAVYPRITFSDLAVEKVYDSTQALDSDGFVTTTISSRFRENTTSNSILNTILRNLFIDTEEVPTFCNGSDWKESPYKPVFARYGFPTRSWQQHVLSEAPEPTGVLKIPMNSDSNLLSDKNLPMSVPIATNLVIYSIFVSKSILRWWKLDEEQWWFPSVSKPVRLAEYFNLTTHSPRNASFVRNAHKLIVDYFKKAGNASTTDDLANIKFTRVNLSEKIVFDALTIEIPTRKYGERRDNSSRANPFNQSLVDYSASYYMCNPKVCMMPNAEEYKYTANGEQTDRTTIYPRVQALAICLNKWGDEDMVLDFADDNLAHLFQSCKQYSQNSMMVVSIGKRIVGDSLEASEDSFWRTVGQAVNARMVYSLTVGRLSWTSEDLAQSYGAECGNPDGCYGIQFQLEKTQNSSTNDRLFISNGSIPINSINPLCMGGTGGGNNSRYIYEFGTKWKALVSTLEETREAASQTEFVNAQYVLPRNFKAVDPYLASREYTYENKWMFCNKFVDEHLNHIEKNHLYIEDSLQPAYTAGLFFIFQNAVVLTELPPGAALNSEISLAFSGNYQKMYLQASIPSKSVLLSIIGCGIMIIGGIVLLTRGKYCERALLEHGTLTTAAEAVTNQTKFPPLMVRVRLQNCTTGQLILPDALLVEKLVLVDANDKTQLFAVQENSIITVEPVIEPDSADNKCTDA
ncbi:unnamed protein product [Phytophthora fragariaefolia]|uniref:Unnamed protein product n=1 Tax=Phytophthora fragariaefolia TaxID=1490495 RepID=A0A9W6WW51_9STRA|nr:unnamed protein product [Phytophthora fragariaefolia]